VHTCNSDCQTSMLLVTVECCTGHDLSVTAALTCRHREEAAAGKAQPRSVQRFGQRAVPALQTALAPFEFKTGKPHMSHRAQACSAAQHMRSTKSLAASMRRHGCSKL